VLTNLESTLLDAVRMGFLHSSRARGRVPSSIRAAADARFLGHTGENGATLLHFELPTFGGVAAEFFQQRLLWDDGPRPEETAFELFGAALHDVAVRRTESNSFDPGLLRRIKSYQRVLTRGVERITMLDTTVLLHWTRDSPQAQAIESNFQLSSSAMRPLICEVSLGEMLAFSLSRNWGSQKLKRLADIERHAVVVGISDRRVRLGKRTQNSRR
jgi:hypothetical protein